jgi:hypothetical protein
MSLLKNILFYLYRYGDKDNFYLLLLNNVWLQGGIDNIVIYIKDKKPYIKVPLGFEYKVESLTRIEQFSILDNMEKNIK